jgi:hypothetical protein
MEYKLLSEDDGTILFVGKGSIGGFMVSGKNYSEISNKAKLAMQGLCVVKCIFLVKDSFGDISQRTLEKLKIISDELDEFTRGCPVRDLTPENNE